jgi:hypothetical protein
MSFADAEIRATASTMARASNATASIAGGAAVPVIFDGGAAAVMGGLADAAQPSIQILAGDLGTHKRGDAITVTYNGVATSYVLRNPLPDGAGMVVCALELVTS